MLNLFPIQWLAMLAYFLLRVITGFVLMVLGFRHLRSWRDIAVVTHAPLFPFPKTAVGMIIAVELTTGLLLTLGLFTQIGALLLISLAIKLIVWHKRFPHPSIPSRLTLLLLFGIGLSLFITGAGAFAFDLPI